MISPYAVSKRLTLDPKTQRLKVKVWKKIFHANNNQKRAEVATLMSEDIGFKSKKVYKRERTFYSIKSFNTA